MTTVASRDPRNMTVEVTIITPPMVFATLLQEVVTEAREWS